MLRLNTGWADRPDGWAAMGGRDAKGGGRVELGQATYLSLCWEATPCEVTQTLSVWRVTELD